MAKDVTLHLSKLPMDDDEKLPETLKQMPRKLPTGEGKKQSPGSGEANKLHKSAEVLQAAGAEQNVGTAEEEEDLTSKQQSRNPKSPKTGR